MTRLGQLVVRDLLRDPRNRYIMFDPQGWLQDTTFARAAEEFGISLVTAGPFARSEIERVMGELEEVPSGPGRQIAVIVNVPDAVDSWSRELGRDWALRDVQASTVFPGLDPELTGTLTLAEVSMLLPKYGDEGRGPRSARATGWILLEDLHGIAADRVHSLEGLLAEAYRLHALGLNVPTGRLRAVRDDLPRLPVEGIEALDCFADANVLLKAIRAATRDGHLAAKVWAKRATFLESHLAPPSPTIEHERQFAWIPEIDAEAVLVAGEQEMWEERSLMWWLDRGPILGSLEILRELKTTDRLESLLRRIDGAFAERVKAEYLSLQNTPWLPRPPMVHHVLKYLASQHGKDRIALIVVDCLSIPMWHVVAEALRLENLDPSLDSTTFAWVPTLTTVSRQALLAGKTPRDFVASIRTTAREERSWREYWESRGVLEDQIGFLKVADDKRSQVLHLAKDSDLTRVAILFNGVDDLVHATAESSALDWMSITRVIVENWLNQTLVPAIRTLRENGWVVFVTSDHGSHKVVRNLGSPREGIKMEQQGRRARIYARKTFARDATLPGDRWEDGGTLPDGYSALLAPAGSGYGIDRGWSHGGASWDEIIVPFVRFGGDAA